MGIKEVPPQLQKLAVAGRISHFLNNWRLVTKDQWVLQTVQGVEIEFSHPPHQARKPHPPQLSQEDSAKVQEEVEQLLGKGAIQKLRPPEAQSGFFSTIFLVPKKEGKMRPVINLKALNCFVEVQHFKMEGMHNLRDLLKTQDWMTKVDLKDAYFAVPIHQSHRQYLRFSVGGQSYQFTCLPFGLSSTPRIFTKILKPVTALLREHGVRLIVYIDDILIMAEAQELAEEHTTALVFLLKSLGFLLSEKSMTTPSQKIDFLGMVVNSVTMQVQVPGEKIKKIRQEARGLLNMTEPSARMVSRVVGKMNALAQGIPPAPLFYRALQRDLTRALGKEEQSYEAACPLSAETKRELHWWASFLDQWNGKSLVVHQPDLVIESDASLRGWGAAAQGVTTGGPWSRQEKKYHINFLEILAASLAVKTFLKNQSNLTVLLKIDNTTAVAYINHMGGPVSPLATDLVKQMWLWCLERSITLKAQYLPGIQNVRADMESRVMIDRSDWMLNPEIFSKIQTMLGPLDIDLFASRLTAHLPRFYSWRPDPQAEGTDALLQDWKDLRAYANPPWNLIGRVLTKTQKEMPEKVVLVAPVWPTQTWYPVLLDLLMDFPRRLPQREDILLETAEAELPAVIPHLAVWVISGKSFRQKAFQMELQSSCWPHGGQNPQNHTIACFKSGLAGVRNGIQIPFLDL